MLKVQRRGPSSCRQRVSPWRANLSSAGGGRAGERRRSGKLRIQRRQANASRVRLRRKEQEDENDRIHENPFTHFCPHNSPSFQIELRNETLSLRSPEVYTLFGLGVTHIPGMVKLLGSPAIGGGVPFYLCTVSTHYAVSLAMNHASFSGSMLPPERKKQIFSPGTTLKEP